MEHRPILYLCMYVIFFSAYACGDTWDTVIFRDDFDVPGNTPDPSRWIVNWPGSSWGTLGRTFFPSPVYHPDAPFPKVEDGKCIIEQHLYNPYDLGSPKWTLLGGEIHTIMQSEPNRPYCFEARVRNNAYPNGLVTSFFTYGYDGSNSDEIDFEFLSNKTNDNVNYPDGDPFPVNTWNESQQWPQYVMGGNLNDWNTFRIYWFPGQRVDWTWLDPINGETLLRSETDPSRVPDEPMALFFNFWAPTADWLDAYSPDLQPVNDPSQNQIYTYEIDYVEVRVPEPGSISLLVVGAIFLSG